MEGQAKAAMTGPLAQNMNTRLAEERLRQIPEDVRLFRKAFGEAPNFDRALNAFAAFERTIVSKNVPFDRYMQGEKTALTVEQLTYTAPYMHNGVFNTLAEVIEFYDQGGDEDPFGTKSPLIKALGLSKAEKAALRAFLESLSSDEILGEGAGAQARA